MEVDFEEVLIEPRDVATPEDAVEFVRATMIRYGATWDRERNVQDIEARGLLELFEGLMPTVRRYRDFLSVAPSGVCRVGICLGPPVHVAGATYGAAAVLKDLEEQSQIQQ